MSLRSAVIKGSALLAVSQVAVQGLTFLRSMIVARQISQEDVGIGSLFILVITLFEMVSSVRPGMLILQAKDGDDADLTQSVHALEFARGLAIAVLAFVLAGPTANWFGIPEATWGFRVVGIVPLMAGLLHHDMIRFQRKFKYGPSLWVDVAPHLVATALAWPLTAYIGDYSAILWLILIRSVLASLISHLVANRAYRWTFDRARLSQILTFGWPLLANGLLMFAIVQGDRLIIGSKYSHFSLAELGLYAMAWNVSSAMTMVMARIGSPLLPLFSMERQDPVALRRHYALSCQLTAVISAAFGILFVLLGGLIMGGIYGSDYRSAGVFIGWLAAGSAFRSMRLIPTTAALAFADTRNVLVANAVRSVSLIGGVATALLGADLVWIAISGLCGEVLSLVVILFRVRRVTGIEVSHCLYPTGFLSACLVAAWALLPVLAPTGPVLASVLCLVALSTMASLGVYLFPEVRSQITRVVQQRLT